MTIALVLPTDLVSWAIFLIIVCGVIGIAVVVIRQTGVTIPPWMIQILWIIVVVVFGIFAIRLLMSLL